MLGRATMGEASFGALLRRHREAAGFSQETLAERAGLSTRGVSDLERGARRMPYRDTVLRLGTALCLQPDDRAELLAASRRVRIVVGHGASSERRLPTPLTSFVGRSAEIEEVGACCRPRGY